MGEPEATPSVNGKRCHFGNVATACTMLGATASAAAVPAARINWRLVNNAQNLVCTVTWNVRGAPTAYNGNVDGVVEKRLVATLPR